MARILLLEGDDSEKWKGLTHACFERLLGRPGDTWRVLSLPRNEFPTTEDVKNSDLVILGGGKYSANSEDAWMKKLLSPECLPAWVATGTKHIGCCLGHQVLAKALGGQVSENPSGRFVLNVEDIRFNKAALASCGLLQAISANQGGSQQASQPLKYIESHGECVSALPPGAVCLASSDSAAVEMWRHGKNVLAFQFHPELDTEMALEKILTAMTSLGRLNEREQAESALSLKEHAPDFPAMQALLSLYRDRGMTEDNNGSVCGARTGTVVQVQAHSNARINDA